MRTKPVHCFLGLFLVGALIPGCEWCGNCKGLWGGKSSGPTYASGVPSGASGSSWNNSGSSWNNNGTRGPATAGAAGTAGSRMGTPSYGAGTNSYGTAPSTYSRGTVTPVAEDSGASTSVRKPADSGVTQTYAPAGSARQPVTPVSGTGVGYPPPPEEAVEPESPPSRGPVLSSPPGAPQYRPQ
jgi:hypothetical protein